MFPPQLPTSNKVTQIASDDEEKDLNNGGTSHLHLPNSRKTHMNTATAWHGLDNGTGAAACLLVMDENPHLIEWLAYHYQILPLRHLIIASDKLSLTSPSDVLGRWEELINITKWTDDDFGYKANARARTDLQHRYRQKTFVAQCLRHFKELDEVSWVFIHDVDEYVTFNRAADDDMTKLDEVQKIRQIANDYLCDNVTAPAHVRLTYDRKKRYLEKAKRTDLAEFDMKGLEFLELRRQLPPIDDETATIMGFMEKIREEPHSPFQSKPCHAIPRLVISAKEGPPRELVNAAVPSGHFDLKNLETLRFYRTAEKGSLDWNRFEKTAIDLSRVSKFELPDKIKNIHSPIKACSEPFVDTYYAESVLKIHHYIGTWEAYSTRADPRRTKLKYDAYSSIDDGAVYDTQSWLRAFVSNVGIERAQILLEGVGNWSSTAEVYKRKYAHGGA